MERKGFRIGSLRGSPIVVEVSFLVLVGLFVVLDLEEKRPMSSALLWIPVLFFSVLLHELAHAAVIGLLRHGPSLIVLGSFGGYTLNERRSRPSQEILVSLAGPVSSFLIALIAWMSWRPLYQALGGAGAGSGGALFLEFLASMARANLGWALFNLIPLHPLDGAQALQNGLRTFMSEARSTSVSIVLSMVIGVLLLAFGVLRQEYFLVVVVAMLLMQNWQRWQQQRTPPASPPEAA